SASDLRIPWSGGAARVIGLVNGQIVTDSLVAEPGAAGGYAVADPDRDLAKIAVVERHLGTGRIGLGFVRGFGLRSGAFASSTASSSSRSRRTENWSQNEALCRPAALPGARLCPRSHP